MSSSAPLFTRKTQLGTKPDAPVGALHIGRRKVEWVPADITTAQPVAYSLSDIVGTAVCVAVLANAVLHTHCIR